MNNQTKNKLKIIIFATLEEAYPLINELKINRILEKPFKVFQNDELVIIISGIGKIRASAACAYVINKFGESKEDKILNAGAAGSLKPNLSMGDVRTIELAADYTENQIKSKIKTLKIEGFESAVLLTSNISILNPDVRDNLSNYGELVDMEGFAIAQTAAIFGRKTALLKIVSDTAKNTSKNEIIENIQHISHLLVNDIIKSLNLL